MIKKKIKSRTSSREGPKKTVMRSKYLIRAEGRPDFVLGVAHDKSKNIVILYGPTRYRDDLVKVRNGLVRVDDRKKGQWFISGHKIRGEYPCELREWRKRIKVLEKVYWLEGTRTLGGLV